MGRTLETALSRARYPHRRELQAHGPMGRRRGGRKGGNIDDLVVAERLMGAGYDPIDGG